jgi:hypothetical protein
MTEKKMEWIDKDKIRISIAQFIVRLWPQYCWATLVVWALGYYDSFWEIIKPELFKQDCEIDNLWCMSCKEYRERR